MAPVMAQLIIHFIILGKSLNVVTLQGAGRRRNGVDLVGTL